MGAVAVKEGECLIFCIFWCQLPTILKPRQKLSMYDDPWEKSGSTNSKSFCLHRREKKMLTCVGGVRVRRTGCQRPGKELINLYISWPTLGRDQGMVVGQQHRAAYYLRWTLHLQSALNPDYRTHLLSLPLLKSNGIRKSASLDLCGMWLEGKPKRYMEKLFLVTESNITASVFKDVGSKWQRNDCFHLKWLICLHTLER